MELPKEKDAFLNKTKKKFDTNVDRKDSDALKAKKISMTELAESLDNIPRKVFIVGEPGKDSARPAKAGENQMQGGPAKPILKEEKLPLKGLG